MIMESEDAGIEPYDSRLRFGFRNSPSTLVVLEAAEVDVVYEVIRGPLSTVKTRRRFWAYPRFPAFCGICPRAAPDCPTLRKEFHLSAL